MAKEKECVRHGKHERRKCPACVWCEDYPSAVRFESGCPMCGQPLYSNGHMMSCGNDDCLMRTTSHPPLQRPRRQVRPEAVGLKGSRL